MYQWNIELYQLPVSRFLPCFVGWIYAHSHIDSSHPHSHSSGGTGVSWVFVTEIMGRCVHVFVFCVLTWLWLWWGDQGILTILIHVMVQFCIGLGYRSYSNTSSWSDVTGKNTAKIAWASVFVPVGSRVIILFLCSRNAQLRDVTRVGTYPWNRPHPTSCCRSASVGDSRTCSRTNNWWDVPVIRIYIVFRKEIETCCDKQRTKF